jgi:hypothetical protein
MCDRDLGPLRRGNRGQRKKIADLRLTARHSGYAAAECVAAAIGNDSTDPHALTGCLMLAEGLANLDVIRRALTGDKS